MPRPRNDEWRVLGPYESADGWRLIVRGPGGYCARSFVPRRRGLAFAERKKAAALATLKSRARSIGQALDEYLAAREDRGLRTAAETDRRLRLWFPALDFPLGALTEVICQGYAKAFGARTYEPGPKTAARRISADYEANALIEARTFLRWCEAQRWIPSNPLAKITGSRRKRRHGKAQLRVDEARRWMAAALRLAPTDDGALAGLCALLLGMRASEITHLHVRDVDDDGQLVWAGEDEAARKTEHARRRFYAPEILRPLLLARTIAWQPARWWLAGSPRPGGEGLWARPHGRSWPLQAIHRICRAASVPLVSAHGMRGLQATLATSAGATAELVAAQLGHADPSTTRESYATRESQAAGAQAAALRVLDGGRR